MMMEMILSTWFWLCLSLSLSGWNAVTSGENCASKSLLPNQVENRLPSFFLPSWRNISFRHISEYLWLIEIVLSPPSLPASIQNRTVVVGLLSWPQNLTRSDDDSITDWDILDLKRRVVMCSFGKRFPKMFMQIRGCIVRNGRDGFRPKRVWFYGFGENLGNLRSA